MTSACQVLLTGIAIAVISLTATAATRRPGGEWDYFHFDGRSFSAGRSAEGIPFVAVRAGFRPVILTHPAKLEAVKLDPGTGALVGICYIQSSGGKLSRGPVYRPASRIPVQISAGDQLVATTDTDDQGYFQAVLAAGKYRVKSRLEVEVTVEKGMTTLVPLRAGKRMVD
jgi:hypothetical protein